MKLLFILIAFFYLTCAIVAAPSHAWNKRPQQFKMQVYSRPFRKGTVQNIRTYIEGSKTSPCWNLSSKRVGSYEVNDPLVKVTFYRFSDCQGAPSATFQNSARPRDHVLIKARSVSITKVKPIVLQKRSRKEL
ncbi:hypothetical protein G6F70_004164 [Rhizopus microsporus]|uniref:Uncharacterized protein n=2 Tax=Rhizopus TaxID=4842 RepID=A0A367KB99_RHIAZ|nr:hypothetical protein G6F71_005494 [Rhizopus microsporus]RCH99446.1 hypothetical protein CU097_010736 [Rhizopus azygosporus]KAG1200314.1 hypothetical protein G6F70_004164 [Rhizopus microsporus]KAG1210282.1 hypothetical protein G6F69_005622 [Rhizopus microsporus]KAG1232026.1 hypothetical protein G6F67_005325 [Rhizopus microsporus]